uniref:Uncharacterized protein n=1 Tax=Porphyridium purpureum TaxID=35688 RepID=W0RZ33_PORPP|nr:hypothetical protein Y721_p168 [Porphyridium purpureum]ATJ02867.1 hypothetical protein [Porphyridium purpureum]BAO23640.1 hypothetical protein [Porphyridium purpureum]
MTNLKPRIEIYPYWNTDLNLVNKITIKSKYTILEDSMLGLYTLKGLLNYK